MVDAAKSLRRNRCDASPGPPSLGPPRLHLNQIVAVMINNALRGYFIFYSIKHIHLTYVNQP